MNLTTERKNWEDAYLQLLKFGSEGVLQNEIVAAKEMFFSKLGRAHEMREELFEIASQSFLEWYLFEYQTKLFQKTPAVVFLTLDLGTASAREILRSSLLNYWSVFEVVSIEKDHLKLRDLLFLHERKVSKDLANPEYRGWKIETGQIFQARLFALNDKKTYFFTHRWLHPAPVDELLRKICDQRAKRWSLHKDLLLAAFEAAVRSYGLQSQIKASGSKNWLYQDLEKRYGT